MIAGKCEALRVISHTVVIILIVAYHSCHILHIRDFEVLGTHGLTFLFWFLDVNALPLTPPGDKLLTSGSVAPEVFWFCEGFVIERLSVLTWIEVLIYFIFMCFSSVTMCRESAASHPSASVSSHSLIRQSLSAVKLELMKESLLGFNTDVCGVFNSDSMLITCFIYLLLWACCLNWMRKKDIGL